MGVGSGRFLAAPGVSGDVCAMRCRCAGERRLVPGVAVSSPPSHLCAAMPSDRGRKGRARRFGEGPATAGVRAGVAAPASSEGVRPPRVRAVVGLRGVRFRWFPCFPGVVCEDCRRRVFVRVEACQVPPSSLEDRRPSVVRLPTVELFGPDFQDGFFPLP